MSTGTRDITAAHEQLAQAAHDLCDPIKRTVLRDDLTATEHAGASLLDQIADIGHGGETGKSRGARSRLPLDPAKLDTWLEIQAAASDLHDRALAHSLLAPDQQIHHIVDLARGWSDPQAVLWVLDHLRVWKSMILSVLEPQRRVSIAAACPSCEARMVLVAEQGTRERVQVDVLLVDMQDDKPTGATCLACGAHWSAQELPHLALVLGCEPIGEAS